MTGELERMREWVGRTETRADEITRTPIALLSATLDRDDPPPKRGDVLPPLWHWLYFLPTQRHSEMGEDGHPKRGGFLPPAPLPRRMFAGARLTFHKPAPADAEWSRGIVPNEVLLFRYSALNFNAHRIHYDRPYASEVEGYPGLIVHGVLIATLLADLVRRSLPQASLSKFSFRAAAPLFHTAPFRVSGKRNADRKLPLWATNPAGALAIDASATVH
jgi:hydroxyacyl-ACP dehydratase HTD2-like protein with hotdog domain